jgi:hypothetical protein
MYSEHKHPGVRESTGADALDLLVRRRLQLDAFV